MEIMFIRVLHQPYVEVPNPDSQNNEKEFISLTWKKKKNTLPLVMCYLLEHSTYRQCHTGRWKIVGLGWFPSLGHWSFAYETVPNVKCQTKVGAQTRALQEHLLVPIKKG